MKISCFKSRMLALVFGLVLFMVFPVFAQDGADESVETSQEGSQDSASSMEAFEQSLAARDDANPDKTHASRLREELMNAVNANDSAEICRLVAELNDANKDNLIAIQPIEKISIFVTKKMYRDLLKTYADLYKTSYDTLVINPQVGEKPVFVADDGLMMFTKKYIAEHDSTHSTIDEVTKNIDSSDLNSAERLELAALLRVNASYGNEWVRNDFLKFGKKYVNEYPDHPDAKWFNESVYGPLSRMSVYDMKMEDRAANKEEWIASKFYTGGFGVNVYPLSGGMAFGFDEYYRDDIYEPTSAFLNFEVYLQISRFAFLFEIMDEGASGIQTKGFGLGYVVYDSRYFKIRPYARIGWSAMSVEYKKDHLGVNVDDYGDIMSYEFYQEGEISEASADNFNAYSLAVDVDFKFATAYFLMSAEKLVSFSLATKFGVSYLDVDDHYVKKKGASLFYGVGLGILFW